MWRDSVALHHRIWKDGSRMMRNSRGRFEFLLVVVATAFFITACQSKKPPVDEVVAPRMDRVAATPSGSQTILHKTFSLTTSASFPFEIPAHAVTPHLHGNYKSFVKQISADASDDSANVDFLILKEDQYADFVHGHAGEALSPRMRRMIRTWTSVFPRPRICRKSTIWFSAIAPADQPGKSCRPTSRSTFSEY